MSGFKNKRFRLEKAMAVASRLADLRGRPFYLRRFREDEWIVTSRPCEYYQSTEVRVDPLP
jgi:hypothetical protein